MKKTCKKMVSVLLVAIMVCSLFAIVPVSVGALTQSEFDSRLNSLRSSYPNYSTWYNSFDGGSQCFGFARLMGYEVFGSYPSTWSVSYDFNSVEAGDIIRYGNNGSGGHSIFVTNVSGSTITFVDCNGNGNYSGATKVRTCGIKWDNTTTIGSRLFGYSFSYIRKSPGITSGNDSNGPSVENFRVDEIESNKFTVYAHIVDSSGVSSVRYAVWTENNGQDDIKWYDGCCTDGNDYYWAHIKFSEHNNEKGTYIIHLYAYDGNGNLTNLGISYKFDTESPTISKFYVDEIWSGGFTIFSKLTDANGISSVRYAVWTSKDGQDDIKWYTAYCTDNNDYYWSRIKFSDHNNEKGSYIIHLYAYDSNGNLSNPGITYTFVSDTGKTVENGKYRIVTAVDETKALDVYGANTDDNTNIQIYSNLNDKKQTFDINYIGDGFYTIFGSYSGKSIDVEGDSYKNRTNVILCGYNGGANQQWIIKPIDDGYCTIVARSNGLALDLAYAKNEDGANVQVHTVNGSIAQKWKLRRVLDSDMITVDTLTVDKDTQTLNPEIQVVADDKALVLNEDYTMEIKGDIESGSGTVTVTGIGDYCDSVTKTFDIVYNDEKLIGDVDGDGIVSVSDATTLQRLLTDVVEFDDEMLSAADTNGDGKIDIKDATLIQKYLAGNVSALG